MHSTKMPCVVSIAGTDPSGGAGIQADIKTISATGAYAATIITALVAQNTQGVQAIQSVSAEFVRLQMRSVFNDLSVDAIKIGMLHEASIIEMIAVDLKKYATIPIVFDPVMVAKDGSRLLQLKTIELLKSRLFPLVDLITPNLFEAGCLLDTEIHSQQDMETAAKQLGDRFSLNVLVKGGHCESMEAMDVLYQYESSSLNWLRAKRHHTKNTHGTGCSLSAAIASYLAQQFELLDAVRLAKDYLTHAIASGMRYQIGQGQGPVDHFYQLRTNNDHS